MAKEKIAIIPAAGIGSRMGNKIPKPFLKLNNKTILEITLQHFLKVEECNIIVVLPKAGMVHWDSLQIISPRIKVVIGGSSRFQSVKNAIESLSCSDDSLIAIHDAVRPFVTPEIIENAFSEAEKMETAITSAPVYDSVRISNGEIYESVDRQKLKLIQTPQVFKYSILKKAYSVIPDQPFTDDASVVEAAGIKLHFVTGNRYNLKITTPDDLKIATDLAKIYNL